MSDAVEPLSCVNFALNKEETGMSMKKLSLRSVLCAAFASLTAPAFAQGPTICMVHNNADHPSITAVAKGMTDEAANFGAEITFLDPAFDPVKQVAMIED
jgi:ABC-type sugar transport system substrate-binding protein